MKITTEQYNVLKLLADDIASARDCPKDMERFVKIVVDDEGKDRVVRKWSPDATRSAILVAMVRSVEAGRQPLHDFPERAPAAKKSVAVEDQSQEVDVFTAEALAKIPAGKPDSSMLNPPRVKMVSKSMLKDTLIRKEGEVWVDENGRYWKMVEGKKRQQKRPKK